MTSNNPYEGQPGPYGQGGQGGPPPGPPGQPPPYGYPPPNQPPGQSGYAFGPFAPQPGMGPGTGGAPPGSGPGPAPQPGAPRRRGKGLIIIGIVALALILIGVTAAVLTRSRTIVGGGPQPSQTAGGSTTSDPPSSAPPTGTLPSDAVSSYLAALAAGDAATALSFSADPVPAGPFMTDAVLAASIKRTPLTAIEVPVVEDQQATTVSATYRLGKSDVSTAYDVVKVGGAWKLAAVSKTIDLGLVRSPSLPMKINGVAVNSDYVDLLPGSYAFTAGSPNLTYGSKSVVVIKDPNDYANIFDLRIALSDEGRKTLLSLARKSYDGCLKTKVTRPKNCPFSWTNSTYKYRTVTWRQAGSDPWRKPAVELVGRSARVRIPLHVRISGSCTFGGSSGTCSGRVTGSGLASMRVDREVTGVLWLT